MEHQYSFSYTILDSENHLSQQDYQLLLKAREAVTVAYAPYSKFYVGAAALLINGEIVTGSNQENASYPSGICAERSLLAMSAQLFPEIAITTMAVSYVSSVGQSNYPASPCGFCRQVLAEFEKRVQQSIRLILCGAGGSVIIIPQSSFLLPLVFNSENLQ